MKFPTKLLNKKSMIDLCCLTSISIPALAYANNTNYRWEPHPEAAYYIGVMDYNGKDIKFKTKADNVLLPSEQPVNLMAYDKNGNLLFSKQVNPHVDPQSIAIDPNMSTAEDSEESQGTLDAETSEPTIDSSENISQEEDLEDKTPEEETAGSRTIEKEMDMVLAIGPKQVKLTGALGKMDDRSNVLNGAIRASACITESAACEQHYQLRLKGYNFKGTYNSQVDQEEDVSYSSLYFNVQAAQQWTWDSFFLRAGISAGGRSLPVVGINDPSTGASSVKTEVTGVLHGNINVNLNIPEGQTLSLEYDLGAYALNHFENYLSHDLSFWWRMQLNPNVFLKLGVSAEQVSYDGYEIYCDDSAVNNCKSGELTSSSTNIHGGLGYRFDD